MRIPRRAIHAATIAAIVLTSLGVAAGLTRDAWQERDRREAERLEVAATVVRSVMDALVDDVDVGATLFDTPARVSGDDFAALTRRLLEAKPALSAVAFVERVPASRRAAYERRSGGPILVPSGGGAVPRRAPDRPVLYPITYIAGRGPGYAAGARFDVISAPHSRSRILRPAASDAPSLTAPVSVLGEGAPAIVVFRPVPRRSEAGRAAAAGQSGFLAAAFRLDRLERDVRAALPPDLTVRVRDVASGAPVMGTRGSLDGSSRTLGVKGREWEVSVAGHSHAPPPLAVAAGASGLVLAGLVGLLLAAAGRGERYVRAQVAARTAELAAERDYSRSLVASMHDGVCVLSRDGTILSVNRRLCQMTGFAQEDLVGRRPPYPFHPEEEGGRLRLAGAFLAEGRQGEFELTYRRADGVRFPVIVSASPLRHDGELVGGVRVVRDVTRQKAAERALEGERDRFRALAAEAPVGIWESDAQGTVTFANARWGEIVGLTPEEAPTGRWADAVHPDDVGAVLATWERSVRDGGEYAVEARLVRPDGSVAWVAAHALAVHDVDGTVRGHIGVLVDVTERRAAAEAVRRSEERVRALLEFAPDAMLVVDGEGTIALANAQAERLFGYAREELVGGPLEILLPERYRAGHAGHRRRYAAAPAPRPMGAGLQLLGRRRDGTEFPIDVSLGPLATPDGEVTVAAVRDASERIALERAKDEFVAIASHELRTPLTAVLGYLQLALEEWGEELSPEVRRCLDVAERRGEDLLALVDDMLSVARADAGRLEMRMAPVDLADLAVRALTAAGPMAQESSTALELDAPEPVGVRGDAERLDQVLGNLVSNALKFTPSGGRVTARVRRDGDQAVLEVEDTGRGISEQDQARVFDRFFRAPAATRDAIPGTGLGLALSRMIVEAHGGAISVESRLGEGSVFRVTLPALEATPSHAPDATEVPA